MPRISDIVFFGTPPFAVESLRALLESGRKVPLVVTQPDRPKGRGLHAAPSAVKTFALERGLPVLQPKKIRDPGFWDALRRTNARIFVVAAYGRILPRGLIDLPEMVLNVHASLLPKWRGAAPIARSILAGDAETGISIMKIAEELDAGDVLLRRALQVGPNETAGELTGRLAALGGEALVEALAMIERDEARFVPQDHRAATFAPPVRPEEGKIDWNRPAAEIYNLIRAFQPAPGAHTSDGKQRIKIHTSALSDEAATASPGTLKADKKHLWAAAKDRWLEILEVQREGKAKQPVSSFLPGYPVGNVKRWD